MYGYKQYNIILELENIIFKTQHVIIILIQEEYHVYRIKKLPIRESDS